MQAPRAEDPAQACTGHGLPTSAPLQHHEQVVWRLGAGMLELEVAAQHSQHHRGQRNALSFCPLPRTGVSGSTSVFGSLRRDRAHLPCRCRSETE